MVSNVPLVTVFCSAYNQESYIKDALEGFVSQKCDFPFEVLVHDDASSDATPTIIREYEDKYPNIIRGVYQTENQYSKGVGIINTYLYPLARGSYFAICEGDDFWVDSNKLQKQIDAFRDHPGTVFCGTASLNVQAETKETISEMHFADESRVVEYKDIIGCVQQYATASFLISRKAYESFLSSGFYSAPAHGDFKLSQFFHSIGSSYYIDEPTVAYRVFAKGSINSGIMNDKHWRETVRLNSDNRIKSLAILDTLVCDDMHELIKTNQTALAYKNDLELKNLRALRGEWRDRFRRESIITKAKVYLASLFPDLYDYSRRIKVR